MRSVRGAALLFVAVMALVGIAGRDVGYADPPPEHAALYAELEGKLTSFEAEVDAEWDGTIGDGQFSATLHAANGNKSVALLGQASWTGSLAMLDAYEAMGVEVIKLEVEYPVFTPAFQSWLAAHPPAVLNPYTVTVSNFIGTPTSFYNRLIDEIRARSLTVWIEHGTLFADYSPTPPGAYFADMRTAGVAATQARYINERTTEAALIVSELEPDYYTILEEPTTQNDNFGYFAGNVPLFDEDGWTGFVEDAAAAIDAAAPASLSQIGAGAGTWDGFGYVQRFAPMPELDFVDLHMYPLQTTGQDYLQNVFDWADYVRTVDPGKFVTMGETWLYKASIADLINGTPYNDILGRDVYSFWETLDVQYLGLMFKMMQHGDIKLVMPFWSQYYWAYLTWGDPDLVGLTGPQLIALAGAEAGPNLLAGILTATGEEFEAMVTLTIDADGDGVLNAPDNCQRWANPTQALPSWAVPAGDPDCDGFPSVATAGQQGRETFVGTDTTDRCNATAAFNDEPLDAWPPDVNDSQQANISDVVAMGASFNKNFGQAGYNARMDLTAGPGLGAVNLSDIVVMGAFFNKNCT